MGKSVMLQYFGTILYDMYTLEILGSGNPCAPHPLKESEMWRLASASAYSTSEVEMWMFAAYSHGEGENSFRWSLSCSQK